MAVKSKVKSKSKSKGRGKGNSIAKPRKHGIKAKPAKRPVGRSRPAAKKKTKVVMPARRKAPPARAAAAKPVARTSLRFAPKFSPITRPITSVVKRVVNHLVERRPVLSRTPRIHQFAYMKAPGLEHAFEVGDTVEVFGDHEKNRERVRGWVRGIVVQVDNKMVAVQFRSNVFLTDGWMVPDRILWYPVNSEHIRPVPGKKTVKKDLIPDY